MNTHTIELELDENSIVFHGLVMFHTYESIYLSGKFLTLMDHKKFHRALMMRKYFDSKYKLLFIYTFGFYLGSLKSYSTYFLSIELR